MTVSSFLSALTPAEGCNIKMLQNGEVVTKCYAAFWSSLSDDLKNATIEQINITSATAITLTLANVTP